ncbi:hypothetical protein GCM10009759_42470 [Kitasatospora saccharophila]|uniref:Uncharacterized protein n=1 Tax=Kitasatospora saccharophila TaxID=407973 RepID=A0ABN2X594_9ACTN
MPSEAGGVETTLPSRLCHIADEGDLGSELLSVLARLHDRLSSEQGSPDTDDHLSVPSVMVKPGVSAACRSFGHWPCKWTVGDMAQPRLPTVGRSDFLASSLPDPGGKTQNALRGILVASSLLVPGGKTQEERWNCSR